MIIGSLYNKLALLSPRIEILLRQIYWKNVEILQRFNPFSAPSSVLHSQKSCDFEDVIRCLKDMGVKEGSLLIVHSSFDALASTGLNQNEIIDKLLELVGKEGTLAMPVIRHYKEEPPVTQLLKTNYEKLVCTYNVKRTLVSSGFLPALELRITISE